MIGVDSNGNKYYEKKDAQVGRNRWVVYAGGQDWINQNSSTVPPEWHGWLHFITDENPANVRTRFLIRYTYSTFLNLCTLRLPRSITFFTHLIKIILNFPSLYRLIFPSLSTPLPLKNIQQCLMADICLKDPGKTLIPAAGRK